MANLALVSGLLKRLKQKDETIVMIYNDGVIIAQFLDERLHDVRFDMRQNFQRMRAYLQDATSGVGRQRPAPSDLSHGVLEQCMEFVAAAQFLSVFPVPGSTRLFRTSTVDPRYIMGSGYFSLIGFLLGLITCIIPWLLGGFVPIYALSALIVVALVVLTGGLHLDGLMDTCDGVFGRADPDRKLEIMRDSRVGSFGVLGALCVLLLKFALFVSLGVSLLIPALLIVPAVARWTMILTARIFPSARIIGLGAAFRQTVTIPRLVLAALVSLLVALIFGHFVGLCIWLGASVVAVAIGAGIARLLGGLTGDVYGAIIEVTEVVALLLFVLVRFWF
jgi:adenosylcobinamide-GDP ribazoletransferase